jgi:glycosyltransferase involved in cell wall biosynthesis
MTLLRAFTLVDRSQTRHRVELLIAGPIWDQTYYKELNDYKREMQLRNVRFVGPVLPCNLPRFLRSADIFAFPSLMETFGIVVLEAMASGLPVVATPVGGLREVVTENETGFLFKPRDYETMAEKLMILSSNRRLRERIGRKARDRVVRCYSSEKNALRMLELYRELS